MNTSFLDQAVAELELHVQKQDAFNSHELPSRSEDIYKTIKVPTIFEKVEYSPCVVVEDNR